MIKRTTESKDEINSQPLAGEPNMTTSLVSVSLDANKGEVVEVTTIESLARQVDISHLVVPHFSSIEGLKTVPGYADENRKFVMRLMDCRNVYRLPNNAWTQVYIQADGFGDIDLAYARDVLEFDWSHVRDSSDKAILRMKIRLAQLGYSGGYEVRGK